MERILYNDNDEDGRTFDFSSVVKYEHDSLVDPIIRLFKIFLQNFCSDKISWMEILM